MPFEYKTGNLLITAKSANRCHAVLSFFEMIKAYAVSRSEVIVVSSGERKQPFRLKSIR